MMHLTQSGDHLISLPEQASWSQIGLATWNANLLQKSTRGLWTLDSGRNSAIRPRSTDPAIHTFAWRKVPNRVASARQFESDDCFTQDGDETYGPESPSIECPLQLVTWSVDHQLRFYPVQRSLTNTNREPLSRAPSLSTTSKHIRQGSGVVELTGPMPCASGSVLAATTSTNANITSTCPRPMTTSTSSSSATTTTTTTAAITTPVMEPRPHAIRRLQSSTGASTKYKSGDTPASSVRGEDTHSRPGISKWSSSGLMGLTNESRDRSKTIKHAVEYDIPYYDMQQYTASLERLKCQKEAEKYVGPPYADAISH
ncbi:unnamed protein product [Echinostoma caproni]|uniref:WD_REPEATS_REGION domain-containing protein n=1 Tax=Echinostoma caproni TaxID=27848 RepID=A0A183B7W7_9TREM|nr:unnamed protein product [Echinostoma caproni]